MFSNSRPDIAGMLHSGLGDTYQIYLILDSLMAKAENENVDFTEILNKAIVKKEDFL